MGLLVALSLIEAADLGDPARDPDALYWLIRIIERSATEAHWGSVSRVEPDRIAAMWQQLCRDSNGAAHESGEGASHSDFVVTADADGNIAAVCHSIDTSLWGTTGIVVDGICGHRRAVATAGWKGARLTSCTCHLALLATDLDTEHGETDANDRDGARQVGRLNAAGLQL